MHGELNRSKMVASSKPMKLASTLSATTTTTSLYFCLNRWRAFRSFFPTENFLPQVCPDLQSGIALATLLLLHGCQL